MPVALLQAKRLILYVSQDGDLANMLALVLTSFGNSSNSCAMKYLVSSVIDHLSWHIDKVSVTPVSGNITL